MQNFGNLGIDLKYLIRICFQKERPMNIEKAADFNQARIFNR